MRNITQQLYGCTVLNEHNTVFASKWSAICNRCFLGPPESSTQTASRSLQLFLQGSLGDRPTDRPHYSVDNNKQSAQWRSQILLLSTATTNIYWSSRLDRSNQLPQSAAIFSCKTRRITVYLETHCNIGSKRAFPLAYSIGDKAVYLFTDTQAV